MCVFFLVIFCIAPGGQKVRLLFKGRKRPGQSSESPGASLDVCKILAPRGAFTRSGTVLGNECAIMILVICSSVFIMKQV